MPQTLTTTMSKDSTASRLTGTDIMVTTRTVKLTGSSGKTTWST